MRLKIEVFPECAHELQPAIIPCDVLRFRDGKRYACPEPLSRKIYENLVPYPTCEWADEEMAYEGMVYEGIAHEETNNGNADYVDSDVAMEEQEQQARTSGVLSQNSGSPRIGYKRVMDHGNDTEIAVWQRRKVPRDRYKNARSLEYEQRDPSPWFMAGQTNFIYDS